MSHYTADPNDINNVVAGLFTDYNAYLNEFDVNKELDVEKHFMVFKDGTTLIRLWGRPLPINLLWLPKDALPYFAREDQRFIVPKEMMPLLAEKKVNPRQAWAINCFDRRDSNMGEPHFKILEKGTFIFKFFFGYEKRSGKGMGDELAPLWRVSTRHTANRMNNRKYVHYDVNCLESFDKADFALMPGEKVIAQRDPRDDSSFPLGFRGPYDLQEIYETEYHLNRFEKIAIPTLERLQWRLKS